MPKRVKQFKVYLEDTLIRRLKYASVETEQSLSALVAQAVDAYLSHLASEGRIEDRSQ
jgi:hypothetical protein